MIATILANSNLLEPPLKFILSSFVRMMSCVILKTCFGRRVLKMTKNASQKPIFFYIFIISYEIFHNTDRQYLQDKDFGGLKIEPRIFCDFAQLGLPTSNRVLNMVYPWHMKQTLPLLYCLLFSIFLIFLPWFLQQEFSF